MLKLTFRNLIFLILVFGLLLGGAGAILALSEDGTNPVLAGYAEGGYYSQGYYYAYSQSSYVNSWEDTAPACGVAGTFYNNTTCTSSTKTQACR